ncbi:hypothetical protein [Blastococcus goldschmidtiae]|uniref:Uncharacterized protein n=1 Tax=Blastococcus goldschmidtiae TaxID=3075546 RepID=A0ABU2K336_9ACTN|nr:hypothetical protein [Blastococcus sp. DSM 46792]MDT0274593.1 hypothetical protein [Blastococcus sp. DSM 46792]
MSTPQDDGPRAQGDEPTVSTAPTSGTAAAPPDSRWWNWGSVPDHLGRARTSTVILSVLFLAIFTLYLNVRPPDEADTAPRRPADGGSDVEAPVVPGLPTESTEEPAPTEEPSPTTEPGTTRTPTTSPSTTSPGTSPAEPTGEPDEPTETSEPAEPTGEPEDEDTAEPTSPSAP